MLKQIASWRRKRQKDKQQDVKIQRAKPCANLEVEDKKSLTKETNGSIHRSKYLAGLRRRST